MIVLLQLGHGTEQLPKSDPVIVQGVLSSERVEAVSVAAAA